jgi:isopenicillin N synthase-like dioxygenase
MLKTVLRRFSGVVNISYPELLAEEPLISKIEEAYGPGGFGVLTISDIPGFLEKREKLLPMASKLAKLSPKDLEKLEVPEVGWSIGWSHGRESYMDVPDFSKGSFYANPEYDEPVKNEEGYHENVWPTQAFPELEPAFKSLGREICRVGYLLAKRIDRYIEYHNRDYVEGLYLHSLKNSRQHVGRLLHYFPKQDQNEWCGWHNDHCSLTGLCSALFLDEETGEIIDSAKAQDETTGLFIRKRDKSEVKVMIPPSSLAFQIGETSQIISCGTLQATPHAVRSSGNLGNVSRNTLAVFMEPGPDFELDTYGEDLEQIYIEHDDVPSVRGRWTPGIKFSEFHNNTIKQFNPN